MPAKRASLETLSKGERREISSRARSGWIAIYKGAGFGDASIMSTMKEIENAVKALPEQDFGRVLMSVLSRARELGSLPKPRYFSDEQSTAWTVDDDRSMEAFRAMR